MGFPPNRHGYDAPGRDVTSVVVCLSKVGSPSALSDCDLNQKLRQAAQESGRTIYIPSGALWGGQDIQRLNDSGGLKVAGAQTPGGQF